MKDVLTTKHIATFTTADPEGFKYLALDWARQFRCVCLLDNNQNQATGYHAQEVLLAVGAQSEIVVKTAESGAFDQLRHFVDDTDDWLFGFLSYDLKNEVERLSSENYDGLGFPLMHFFQPKYLLRFQSEEVIIESNAEAPEYLFSKILQHQTTKNSDTTILPAIRSRFSQAEYLQTVARIREHIIEGDIYEMNFCQEFFAEDCTVDPQTTFRQLNELSKAPFAAFYQWHDRYLMCASPERFLQKKGRKIISQPIKGTIARGQNEAEDQRLKETLRNSEKDKAENVMIVDLVRNDLARTCEAGSVKVEELFGIYPFAQVFQMISTVSGILRPDQHLVDAIRQAFPMGSMTGAPKVMSMQLIEQYERSRRGLYSGAVGYITPEGDFDFNVVIRSLLYNATRKYLSFQVGGAIVFDSVPEAEYAECLLKAEGIRKTLGVE